MAWLSASSRKLASNIFPHWLWTQRCTDELELALKSIVWPLEVSLPLAGRLGSLFFFGSKMSNDMAWPKWLSHSFIQYIIRSCYYVPGFLLAFSDFKFTEDKAQNLVSGNLGYNPGSLLNLQWGRMKVNLPTLASAPHLWMRNWLHLLFINCAPWSSAISFSRLPGGYSRTVVVNWGQFLTLPLTPRGHFGAVLASSG